MLADALRHQEVVQLVVETCHIDIDGSFFRMKYIQGVDGLRLEPHWDTPGKLLSMVIYFFVGPDAKDWGTDIYDAERQWVGRSSGEYDSGVIFVPGPNTWRSFQHRPIIVAQRLMGINYAPAAWRYRDQLFLPDHPIAVAQANQDRVVPTADAGDLSRAIA